MDDSTVLLRLRRFLLTVAGAIFIGTILELLLIGHTEEPMQWVPFIASGMGILIVAIVYIAPSKQVIRTFRWMMSAVALTAFIGMYQHFSGNLAFAHEIHPAFSGAEAMWTAIFGSNPLLAPGILFLAGILAIAATYKHPFLQD